MKKTNTNKAINFYKKISKYININDSFTDDVAFLKSEKWKHITRLPVAIGSYVYYKETFVNNGKFVEKTRRGWVATIHISTISFIEVCPVALSSKGNYIRLNLWEYNKKWATNYKQARECYSANTFFDAK